MTFADDYASYQLWKQSWDDSPDAWERRHDLEKDATFYRGNKADIDEALDMLYRVRGWWVDSENEVTNDSVGKWFIAEFADQLNDFCFSDD